MPYILGMTKTILFYLMCLAPVVFGIKLWIDAVRLSDAHLMRLVDCMTQYQRTLDRAPEEAYTFCEARER